jgi:hypothetical protein
MRTSRPLVLACAALGLTLVGGCSTRSMRKEYDRITGRDDTKDSRVDLNTAGRKRLAQLPGLTGDDADRIVANRPYQKKRDLVTKGVLTQAKFDRIRDDVYLDHEKE